jgi:hypothetical protein
MYQVRFEDSTIRHFNTFLEAFEKSALFGGWKISFNDERWVKYCREEIFDEGSDTFSEEDIEAIKNKFTETGKDILWINQPLIPQTRQCDIERKDFKFNG